MPSTVKSCRLLLDHVVCCWIMPWAVKFRLLRKYAVPKKLLLIVRTLDRLLHFVRKWKKEEFTAKPCINTIVCLHMPNYIRQSFCTRNLKFVHSLFVEVQHERCVRLSKMTLRKKVSILITRWWKSWWCLIG